MNSPTPPDIVTALAGIISTAIASNGIDRIELDRAIGKVLHGPAMYAERLGIAVATAAQAALPDAAYAGPDGGRGVQVTGAHSFPWIDQCGHRRGSVDSLLVPAPLKGK